MAEITYFPSAEDCDIIPETEHNLNGRDGQGPPVGSYAWVCLMCDNDSFAFYITPSDIRCYHCHAIQEF